MQAKEPGAYRLFMSDIWALPRTNQWVNRTWTSKDKVSSRICADGWGRRGLRAVTMHGVTMTAIL